MSKQAQVGLFTIVGLLASFAIFYFIGDLGTRTRGCKIGVHFDNTSGLRTGAVVYLSGVPIGSVDAVNLLKDYTTQVVLALRNNESTNNCQIPAASKFIVQAPLTGEPSVLIDPPRGVHPDAPMIQEGVLPPDQEPKGENAATVAELLHQGQGEIARVDAILSELKRAEPKLIGSLQQTLDNSNHLTKHADESLSRITDRIDTLTVALQGNLTTASSNVAEMTGRLNGMAARDSARVDALLIDLQHTAKSFDDTAVAVHGIATDPRVKANLIDTTRDFALTAKTFAEITGDLRNVTGNPQTQAQLRDTVAQMDATTQRVNSLVGQFGGKSSVYGVDAGATPAAASSASAPATPWPPGFVPTSKPLLPVPGTSSAPAAAPQAQVNPAPAPTADGGRLATGLGALRSRLSNFAKDLVQLQVRVGELSPARPGSLNTNRSPLLTTDRGPQSDFNLYILPKARTGLEAGVNDTGSSGTSTGNLMLISRRGALQYGGGILYSRLGVQASVSAGLFGLETRAYDLRHPTLDTYLNINTAPKFQLFGGERDVTHVSRRTVFGLQFEL